MKGLHTTFDRLLQKYVSNDGRVKYKELQSERELLQGYITTLENHAEVTSMTENEELAYWINFYNALTILLITDHYPISSIMKINDGKAWDLQLAETGDRSLSLNDIEHRIIRRKFDKPSIHFAVNCAALSCPKLLNEAYTADKLSNQFAAQKDYFLNNPKKNLLQGNPVKISRIFDWYKEDFGELFVYLKDYLGSDTTTSQIDYMEYDWALNDW
ncbi:MAG: DUF547 domain-containing protein [Cyclobacteriaceae bacterium]